MSPSQPNQLNLAAEIDCAWLDLHLLLLTVDRRAALANSDPPEKARKLEEAVACTESVQGGAELIDRIETMLYGSCDSYSEGFGVFLSMAAERLALDA